MDTTYSAQLKEVMDLIMKEAPKPQILAKARDIKIRLSTSWTELVRVINLLDGMVNQFAPDKDWPQGFWLPPTPIQAVPPPRFIAQSGVVTPRQTSLVTQPQRILEVAKGVMTEGIVASKTIIDRLRAEGDQRPEKSLAISVGNVLTRHGWQWVGPGKYRLVEKQEGKEAK